MSNVPGQPIYIIYKDGLEAVASSVIAQTVERWTTHNAPAPPLILIYAIDGPAFASSELLKLCHL